MSTLTSRVQDLIRMCDVVGWDVVPGGKHLKVIIPGQALPLSLPSTPSSDRIVKAVEGKLKRAGLNERYDQVVASRSEKVRNQMTATKARTNSRIAAINQAAAEEAARTAPTALLKNGMTIGEEYITPEMAEALLATAANAEGFRQRPVNYGKVDEYVLEMSHGRWIEMLPDGIIGIDEQGVLINGQKRMIAVAKSGQTIGFIVARNVPRSMFPYFDMAQKRSAADTFAIAGLPAGNDAQSAVKLAMAYEGMLHGGDRISWASWNKWRVSNSDALAYYQNHQDLGDFLEPAKALMFKAKMVTASVMVFQYFANKAWPQDQRGKDKWGMDPLQSYLVGIRDGEKLVRTDAAYVVRDWSISVAAAKERIPSKRETFLFLLFRYWEYAAAGKPVQTSRVNYKRDWPMPLPYHPDGPEAAVRNILS